MPNMKYILITIGLCAASFSLGYSIQPSLPKSEPLIIKPCYEGNWHTEYKTIQLPIKLDLDTQGMARKLSPIINASALRPKQ